MERKIFEKFIGQNVEIMLMPGVPRTSGKVLRCEDDYIVIGDELWSYSAILGVRPLKKHAQAEVKNDSEVEVKEVTAPNIEPEVNLNVDVDLEGREFEGTIVAFYYDRGFWGFIESDDVKNLGVPLRDGERVFVHLNQITDEALKNKLMTEKNSAPMIKVIFKLGKNKHGAVADDVHAKEPVNTASEKLPAEVLKIDMASAIYEEGEIEYFRRYDAVPNGEIRVPGNTLYRFEEEDVIDPALAVFLECSPSAEGQKVKFIKVPGKKGKDRATNISASVPFPEEKINDWEKSGLIQKAKERLGIKENN